MVFHPQVVHLTTLMFTGFCLFLDYDLWGQKSSVSGWVGGKQEILGKAVTQQCQLGLAHHCYSSKALRFQLRTIRCT